MNKKQLIDGIDHIVRQVNLGNNYSVGFGSAMVIHGVRPTTNDIDMWVDRKHEEAIKNFFEGNEVRFVRVKGKVTRIECGNYDVNFDKMDGYEDMVDPETNIRVQTPENILKIKKEWNRPKDQNDIVLLTKLVEKKQSK